MQPKSEQSAQVLMDAALQRSRAIIEKLFQAIAGDNPALFFDSAEELLHLVRLIKCLIRSQYMGVEGRSELHSKAMLSIRGTVSVGQAELMTFIEKYSPAAEDREEAFRGLSDLVEDLPLLFYDLLPELFSLRLQLLDPDPHLGEVLFECTRQLDHMEYHLDVDVDRLKWTNPA